MVSFSSAFFMLSGCLSKWILLFLLPSVFSSTQTNKNVKTVWGHINPQQTLPAIVVMRNSAKAAIIKTYAKSVKSCGQSVTLKKWNRWLENSNRIACLWLYVSHGIAIKTNKKIKPNNHQNVSIVPFTARIYIFCSAFGLCTFTLCLFAIELTSILRIGMLLCLFIGSYLFTLLNRMAHCLTDKINQAD